MAKYDVWRDTAGACFLDIQASTLSDLNTRIVVPLMPPHEAPVPGRKLNPKIAIDGVPLIMVTQYLAATPVRELGLPVTNLIGQADEINAALDMLLYGF